MGWQDITGALHCQFQQVFIHKLNKLNWNIFMKRKITQEMGNNIFISNFTIMCTKQ
jgi:hypothetical protein